MEKPRIRVPALSEPAAAYFRGERNMYMAGYRPALREPQTDTNDAWLKAAGRSIDLAQNSGFLRGIIENATGMTVGPGLMLSARPDGEALGWTPEKTREIGGQMERVFRAWARNPMACDASATFTFGQMQQIALGSYFVYGEYAAFAPLFKRAPGHLNTKLLFFPPSRISQETQEQEGLYQGVYVDAYGAPVGYKIKTRTDTLGWIDQNYRAYDQDGRPLVIHGREPSLASTRSVGPFTTIINAARQYDQVFNAVVTKKLTQAIFAAALKTNMGGMSRFDGLMLPGDKEKQNESVDAFLTAWGGARGEFYDGAGLDLSTHGRIAHLFPGDEFQFIQANGQGELQDEINTWLLREICQGAGVLYETGTGDYRGSTYSSVRMGGAVEWLTVIRRRENLIMPFCNAAYRMVQEEAVATGKVDYPGGLKAFREEIDYACQASWAGPARPQADDFKTARAMQVRKDMGGVTMAEVAAEYGQDWDDMMRQQKRENDLAEELGLPLPHAPTDPLQTPEGQDLELNAPANSDPNDRPQRRNRTKPKDGVRDDNPDRENRNQTTLDAALEAELNGED